MSPHRLRACLEILGWSQRELAAQVGVDPRQVVRWISGAAIVPLSTEAWLENLVALHLANPAPEKV
jgi:transcriptional regulator with XRE-family HTH domain